MARIEPGRTERRPTEAVEGAAAGKSGAAAGAGAQAKGLRSPGGPRINPFVSRPVAYAETPTPVTERASVRLPPPGQLVASFRDGLTRGFESWLGGVLPAGAGGALGAEGMAELATAVRTGLPGALETSLGGTGLSESVSRDLARALLDELQVRMIGLAAQTTTLMGELVEMTKPVLETVGEGSKAVLQRLLSGGGEGLFRFAENLVRGVTTGFRTFGNNVLDQLKSGVVGWLRKAIPDDVELPRSFDAKELVGFSLNVLGRVGERMLELLESRLPASVTDALDWGAAKAQDLIERGPAGLARDLLGALGGFVGKVAEEVGPLAVAGVEAVGEVVGGVVRGVGRAVEGEVEAVGDLLQGHPTKAVGSAVGGVVGGAGEVAGGVVDAAGTMADAVLSAFGF
jgi:hypothetical protein